MDKKLTVVIDRDRCTGCGQCQRVCPGENFSFPEGKAAATGERSINCDHCGAVCPAQAIRVGAVDPEAGRFATFEADPRWLPHGQPDPAQLARLMASRRSCRNYTEAPVGRDVLLDLVKMAITAPSGTNCQPWTFTVLPTRPAVLALAARVVEFFKRLNRMAERRWLTTLLRLVGRPELDQYRRGYYELIKTGLLGWEKDGRDLLFRGATAAIVVAARTGGSCPAEDALLATQNMVLGAHALGLGSCLIGFVVAAMKKDPTIQHALGMPADEVVHAVVALGHPDERYVRVAGRELPTVRWSEG